MERGSSATLTMTPEMIMSRIIVLTAVVALSCGGWKQRDSFYREARCGLSVDTTRTLAERSGGTGWICATPSAQLTVCNFRVGQTRVSLEFEDGKLQSLEDGDYFGIKGFASRPKENVCTRGRSRSVIITVPDNSWIGAAISANGEVIGTITAGHAQSVDVPLGRYILQVAKSGHGALRHEITVPDGTLRVPPEVDFRSP
jgi:hypothetical protein